MDLLTRTELVSLAQPGPDGTYVSLFMPTHRVGERVEADQLRWKNLVNRAETLLLEDLRRPDVEALLAPAHQLHDDPIAWRYMSEGLAMFLGPGGNRTFQVAAPMPELATVGARPVLGPTLRLCSGDERFLVLALSQRDVRLLEGSRNTVEPVHLPDLPTSLRDAVEPDEPRSHTMARPADKAGRGGPAVFYGHGAGDRHLKKDEVLRFLRSVDAGLHAVLARESAPMVLVGLDPLVSAYREVNTYGHVLDDAVEHNADQLEADGLHEMAWPLVERRLREERAKVVDRFHELAGAGRASGELPVVAEAAAQGRVETLFVRTDPWCWEQAADGAPAVVALGADERYLGCEQVDAAAVATLTTRGQVYATSETVVPGSEVAAIFRY